MGGGGCVGHWRFALCWKRGLSVTSPHVGYLLSSYQYYVALTPCLLHYVALTPCWLHYVALTPCWLLVLLLPLRHEALVTNHILLSFIISTVWDDWVCVSADRCGSWSGWSSLDVPGTVRREGSAARRVVHHVWQRRHDPRLELWTSHEWRDGLQAKPLQQREWSRTWVKESPTSLTDGNGALLCVKLSISVGIIIDYNLQNQSWTIFFWLQELLKVIYIDPELNNITSTTTNRSKWEMCY